MESPEVGVGGCLLHLAPQDSVLGARRAWGGVGWVEDAEQPAALCAGAFCSLASV